MASALKVWDGTQYVTIAGVKGDAATISVGSTTTAAPGGNATVTNTGTSGAAVFDFTIPQGDAATVAAGSTTTGASGTSASVVNSGTSSAAVFDFTIPEGASAYDVAVSNGFVGTEQDWLNSIHDTLFFASFANFPATGELDKLHIAEDTGYMYWWTGAVYTQLTGEIFSSTEQTKLSGIATGAEVNTVDSVNTQTGAVVLTTTDIDEGDNLYHTTARARSSISATGDISYSSATGVISFSETYSTASEVKTAYESNADTNAFTDALQTKLNGIETAATADQTKIDIDALGIDAATLDGSVPADFAAATHTHIIGDVTGLQTELDTINTALGDVEAALNTINGVVV